MLMLTPEPFLVRTMTNFKSTLRCKVGETEMTRYRERQHDKYSRRTTVARWLSVWLLCCFAAFAGRANAQIVLPGPGIINTLAGNGTEGFAGDGGPATSAEFYTPEGTVLDSLRNIYIADVDNYRVRAINPGAAAVTIAGVVIQPGDISTIAGQLGHGYPYCSNETDDSGDGCPATEAFIEYPTGVAVDTAGNIYISEEGDSQIRKVTASTGIISLVVGGGGGYGGDGGPASGAKIYVPEDVAVDGAGNIYISDTGNNRIRSVNLGTQAVTIAGIVIQPGYIATVAGNGTAGYSGDGGAATSAEINSPIGVKVDSAGNIYIGDFGNYRIRKVTAAGIISTVAGNGTAGYSGDGGAATSAELNGPAHVALDGSGNIYFADANNNRIRVVNTGTLAVMIAGTVIQPGDIATVAGDGTGGYSGDGGAATGAELWTPWGVAVDSAGDIYIADRSNERIRVVGTSAPAITSISPASGTSGTVVTIVGSNFGATQGTSTVTFNGAAATPTTWAAGQIVVPAPAGVLTGNIIVTVNGIPSNSVWFVGAPIITSLSPTSGAITGTVTITGTNFNLIQGTSTVTFNGTSATPTSWSVASIVVSVPSGATTGPVIVTVGGTASNSKTFTVTAPPVITSLSPTSYGIGEIVTITGTTFGSSRGTSTITFNGTAATSKTWSATSITVPVPTGATTGNVVVTVTGVASNGKAFTVLPTPNISSLSPAKGPNGDDHGHHLRRDAGHQHVDLQRNHCQACQLERDANSCSRPHRRYHGKRRGNAQLRPQQHYYFHGGCRSRAYQSFPHHGPGWHGGHHHRGRFWLDARLQYGDIRRNRSHPHQLERDHDQGSGSNRCGHWECGGNGWRCREQRHKVHRLADPQYHHPVADLRSGWHIGYD